MSRVWLAMVAVLGVAACSDNVDTTSTSASLTVGSVATASSSPAPDPSVPASPILSAVHGDVLGTTQLSLLSNGAVVDADSGTRQTIDGLPPLGDVYWADRVDGATIVTIDCVGCAERPQVFIVREGEHEAEHVVDGVFVTPALEGLWAKTFLTDTTCELSRINLTGHVVQQARPIDCRLGLVEETALGLVAFLDSDWVLISAADFTEIHRWSAPSRLAAIVGQKILIDDTHAYTLFDTGTGEQSTVAAPKAFGHPSYGIVSPDGQYVAFEYRHPDQIMDLWLLDLRSMQWAHAPSMPVFAGIKRPGPTWTSDGRLAVLGYFGQPPASRYLLIMWRPGDTKLSFRPTAEQAWFIV